MKRFFINIAISTFAYLLALLALDVIRGKDCVPFVALVVPCLFAYYALRKRYADIYRRWPCLFAVMLLFVLYALHFRMVMDTYILVTIIYILIVFAVPNTLFMFLLHRYDICTDFYTDELKMLGENAVSALIYSMCIVVQGYHAHTDIPWLLCALLSHVTIVTFFLMRYMLHDN